MSHVFLQGESAIPVLDNVNLSVRQGEFVAVVGASGCGKTTILGMVAGLVKPAAGTIRINGKPVTGPSRATAYMLARDALLPWKTAIQNVELGLSVRGVEAARRRQLSMEWMSRVGLAGFEQASVAQLSQGMRQRVALARTLSMSPRCILMDEPFAALDAQTRLLLQQEFLGLWERVRASVIFVTHDLAEAILLADRVVLMTSRPGRVALSRPVLIDRPRSLTEQVHSKEFHELYDELWQGLRDQMQGGKRG